MKINRNSAVPAALVPLVALLLAGCSAQQVVPARPAPATAPRPTPAPPPPAPGPAPADWRAVPLTPGSWSYGGAGSATAASFLSPQGDRLFALVCHRERGALTALRAGAASAPLPMSIVTTYGVRPFTVQPATDGSATLVASLGARDPALDEIAFSRGRIAIEVNGLPTLYLPAWAELGKVIEDCR